MPTLLLRLAGPMQSWGTQSRFDERGTDLEPSKSGVLGLLCAALGIERSNWAQLAPLAALHMGVRVDQPGALRRDYHTAQSEPGADSGRTDVTQRYYLSDAVFLVGLEGVDRELLERADVALRNPHWPLYLGRKAFVPSQPLSVPPGVVEADLETALRTHAHVGTAEPPTQYRLILESTSPEGSLRMDQPIASFAERRFGGRYVRMSVQQGGGTPDAAV